MQEKHVASAKTASAPQSRNHYGACVTLWSRDSRFGQEQLREKISHVVRRAELTGDALGISAYREGEPVEIGHNCEHGFIGDVIADEQRTATLERFMHHQFAHAASLGETGMLD